MSLPALALLIAATGALRDVAPDWMRVEMSPREPLALAEGAKKVIVAVFVGDQIHDITRRQWFSGSRTAELAVQVLLPPVVEAEFEGVSARFECHLGGSDVVFATVHRYLEIAFGAPAAGSWGELFQDLVTSHDGQLEGRPFTVGGGQGVQVPAIDYSLPCKTIPSPALSGPVPAFWAKLVDKMRATPDVAGAADYVEALVKGVPLPPWRAEQALAGLSAREGVALGLGLIAPLTDTPLVGALVIEGDLGVTRVEAPAHE